MLKISDEAKENRAHGLCCYCFNTHTHTHSNTHEGNPSAQIIWTWIFSEALTATAASMTQCIWQCWYEPVNWLKALRKASSPDNVSLSDPVNSTYADTNWQPIKLSGIFSIISCHLSNNTFLQPGSSSRSQHLSEVKGATDMHYQCYNLCV